MGMYRQFASDSDREKNGIVVDYVHFRVTVARAGGGNKSYGKALEAKTREYRRAIVAGVMDAELSADIIREVYAETVVRNWEVLVGEDGKPLGERPVSEGKEWVQGIEGEDGSLLPFTAENVERTLKALPDLFRDIRDQSESMVLYRESLRDELGKG